MATAQELLDAGVDPKNIPTLTAELNKSEFGGLADTEFMVEAGRFGNTDPALQLGLNWWWDTQGERTQIFDTGEPFDTRPWSNRGSAFSRGTNKPKGFNTADNWAQKTGYKDGADWFYSMKAKGELRPEVVEKGFDEWEKDMLELGKEEALAMYIQGKNPLQPETWEHELSHIGQYILRRTGVKAGISQKEWKASGVGKSSIEEKQRVRDIMMSSPGDPAYENAHKWLQNNRRDIPYTPEEIREIAERVLIEDKYANRVLESQGGLAKSSGDLSQYEKEYMPDEGKDMPGFWDSMMKKLGLD
jgi:hypothetical protein|tara:strand:+ start:1309 stop:2214 length:906 start_codon:yes stop_codon:yes gene_type:complete